MNGPTPEPPKRGLRFPDAQFKALGLLLSSEREQVYTVVTARQLDAATERAATLLHDHICEDHYDPTHTGNERADCVARHVPTAHHLLEHALFAAAQLPYDPVKDAIVVGPTGVIDARSLLQRLGERSAFWVDAHARIIHQVPGCQWYAPAVDRLGSLTKTAEQHLQQCPHR